MDASNSNRPNVIVFFTDQQRWDSSGLHGNPLELMPNFDRLARAGTHVAKSFTCQPVCGPARACLQTGTYATTTGCHINGIALPTDRKQFPSLASCFNQAGYRTGYIGKWHLAGQQGLGAAGERGAIKAGYRGDYTDWLAVEALEFSVDEYHTILYDNDNKPIHLPGYRTDACTDAAIRYVDAHKHEPFFLMVSYIEPHHQNDKDDYPAPNGYRERYTDRWTPPDLHSTLPHWHHKPGEGERTLQGGSAPQHLGGYWGMVKRLDEALGRLIDTLITLDLLDNTIVLFTSDHGCHFKTRNSEYKRSCHESSIRVPTMLHGGPFTGGGELSQLVSLVDLPPTLLDACNIPIPATMQGRSILPLVNKDARAAADWPEEVFVQISESQVGRAVRTQRWKYGVTAPDKHPNKDSGSDVYVDQYLYDLKYDPYELRNLVNVDNFEPVLQVMRERLVRRMTQAGEKAPRIDPHPGPKTPGGQRKPKPAEIHQ